MKKILFLSFLMFFSANEVFAQEKTEEAPGEAQANNPLANMTALNIQNYYMPNLNDAPSEAYMNTSWLRFAKPFASGKLLLRVSAPISTIGLPDSLDIVRGTNGLGDINAFVSYNFYSKPTGSIGIGPLISAPTASEDMLGSGKWQAGLAFVAFIAKNPKFQWGGLITWQTSIGGDEDRAETNMASVQPFYFWQLGKGNYLRGAPIWVFDIENEAYSVPIGAGLGKIVKVGNTVCNIFVEPQYSMVVAGNQPVFQIFTGINLQFTK